MGLLDLEMGQMSILFLIDTLVWNVFTGSKQTGGLYFTSFCYGNKGNVGMSVVFPCLGIYILLCMYELLLSGIISAYLSTDKVCQVPMVSGLLEYRTSRHPL